MTYKTIRPSGWKINNTTDLAFRIEYRSWDFCTRREDPSTVIFCWRIPVCRFESVEHALSFLHTMGEWMQIESSLVAARKTDTSPIRISKGDQIIKEFDGIDCLFTEASASPPPHHHDYELGDKDCVSDIRSDNGLFYECVDQSMNPLPDDAPWPPARTLERNLARPDIALIPRRSS